MPSGTVWAAGSVVEVSWTIEANHGGGYQYRLAPAAGPLTEATFGKMPLPFVGKQSLRWGGSSGTTLSFDGTYVSQGTTPTGSTWVMNPIPRNDFGQTGEGFPPHCNDPSMCQGMTDGSVAVPNLGTIPSHGHASPGTYPSIYKRIFTCTHALCTAHHTLRRTVPHNCILLPQPTSLSLFVPRAHCSLTLHTPRGTFWRSMYLVTARQKSSIES